MDSRIDKIYMPNVNGHDYSLIDEGFYGWKPTLGSEEFDIVKIVNVGYGLQLKRFDNTFAEHHAYGVYLYKIA